MRWDARVQPSEIGVAVKDGVVTVMGWVDSYTKKWAAEEAAHRVRGVMAVANDIEVRLPVSAERNDADIAAAAIRALEWDAFVPVDKLDITVSKGWVTLKGEVEWQYLKLRAPASQPAMVAVVEAVRFDAQGGRKRDRRGGVCFGGNGGLEQRARGVT